MPQTKETVYVSILGKGQNGSITCRVKFSESGGALSHQLQSIYLSQHDHGEWVNRKDFDNQPGSDQFKVYVSRHGHAMYYKGDSLNATIDKTFPKVPNFLSTVVPIMRLRIANLTSTQGAQLNGRESFQIIKTTNFDTPVTVPLPSWLMFEGRWGAKAAKKFDDWDLIKKVLDDVLKEMFTDSLLSSLIIVVVPQLGLAILSGYTVLQVKPSLLPIEDQIPNELTNGDGPRGPNMKANWLGEE